MIFSKRATPSLRALFGTISDSGLFFPLHIGHCCFPIPHFHSSQLPLSSCLFILSLISPTPFPHFRQLYSETLLISSCLFIQHLASVILCPNKQTDKHINPSPSSNRPSTPSSWLLALLLLGLVNPLEAGMLPHMRTSSSLFSKRSSRTRLTLPTSPPRCAARVTPIPTTRSSTRLSSVFCAQF